MQSNENIEEIINNKSKTSIKRLLVPKHSKAVETTSDLTHINRLVRLVIKKKSSYYVFIH